MNCHEAVLGLAVLTFVTGCSDSQTTQPSGGVSPAAQVSETQRVPDLGASPGIEVSDLLDALQVQMWKSRVNEDSDTRISTVSLMVKTKGSDPMSELSIDLTENDHGPGTLLVFIQYAQGARVAGGETHPARYSVGLIYEGDDGHSTSTRNTVDDPLHDVIGSRTSPSAYVGRAGIIALMTSGYPGGDDITEQQAAGFFLNNEE